jgi:hypothetical protein
MIRVALLVRACSDTALDRSCLSTRVGSSASDAVWVTVCTAPVTRLTAQRARSVAVPVAASSPVMTLVPTSTHVPSSSTRRRS